ncbi:MAG: hypothetical protein LBN27_09840 [Prevotellaceae bacterium]|jgi:hypothetical protein|nr:hypothetical protein [Prevotellaceae bacterium]
MSEEEEKRYYLQYAKENNLWIKSLYSLGVPFVGGGNENTLAYDEKNKIIYKSNNLINHQFSIIKLLESIEIHNQLFPETKYDIVGFTGMDYGENRTPYIEVILKQDYITNVVQATQQEIISYMHSIGFEQVNEHTFANKQYTVSDLRPRNVLKDTHGNIYVIDNIVSKIEKI